LFGSGYISFSVQATRVDPLGLILGALINITFEFFSFNVWEWFFQSSVFERTESDLSKINWLRGMILLHSNSVGALGYDTIQEMSNSDSDVKYATIQFYDNSHNSQFSIRPLDRAESLCKVSWDVVLPWVKFSGQSKFGKALKHGSTEAVWILLFTSFWLVDFLFG